MIGEGDLDPSEGQSQPLVGTLPLTEKDPLEKPEDKGPPPSSSVEGLDTEAHDKDESITPSSPGSSDKTEETPTSPIRTRILNTPQGILLQEIHSQVFGQEN